MKMLNAALKAYEAMPADPQEQTLYKEFTVELEKWKAAAEPTWQPPEKSAACSMRERRRKMQKIIELEDKAFSYRFECEERIESGRRETRKEYWITTCKAARNRPRRPRPRWPPAFGPFFVILGLGSCVLLGAGVVLARTISRTLRVLIDEACRLSAAAVAGKLQTRGNPELVDAGIPPHRRGRQRHARRRDRPLERLGRVRRSDLQGRYPGRRSPTPTTAISTRSRTTSTSASTP